MSDGYPRINAILNIYCLPAPCVEEYVSIGFNAFLRKESGKYAYDGPLQFGSPEYVDFDLNDCESLRKSGITFLLMAFDKNLIHALENKIESSVIEQSELFDTLKDLFSDFEQSVPEAIQYWSASYVDAFYADKEKEFERKAASILKTNVDNIASKKAKTNCSLDLCLYDENGKPVKSSLVCVEMPVVSERLLFIKEGDSK